MTKVNLDPNGTTANTGAVTGSSAHAALSDGSDATFVDFDYGEGSILTLSDLSLPSGALLLAAQVMVRCRKDGTGPGGVQSTLVADTTKESTGSVTWESAATLDGVTIFDGTLTDAGLDGASIGVACVSLSSIRAYKAWVQVTYFTKPTVTVTAPTGTVSSNIVRVFWTPSFDADADSSAYSYEVKVFSSAQYGAGGFDPSTSTATLSGSGSNGAGSLAFTSVLADGDYRAYVRVAAKNTPSHWSDWDYEAFTVDVDKPGDPTVDVTADSDNGRVAIALDDTAGDVSTTHFQVQRADDGVNFVDVRTDLGDGLVATSGSLVTIYDYEAPNGSTVTYRARAYASSVPSYSGWVTDTGGWSSGAEWLKCMLDPDLNLSLVVRSYQGFEVPSNTAVYRPLSSSTAIVTGDTPGPEQGSIVLFSKSDTDREDLAALLASSSPVLVQVPGHPDRCVRFGDRSSQRIVDAAWEDWHEETLGWTVVDRP